MHYGMDRKEEIINEVGSAVQCRSGNDGVFYHHERREKAGRCD